MISGCIKGVSHDGLSSVMLQEPIKIFLVSLTFKRRDSENAGDSSVGPKSSVMVPGILTETAKMGIHLGVTKAMQGRLMLKMYSFSGMGRSTNSIT